MAKDKLGGVPYVCQTSKKEHSDNLVLPLFVGNCFAADRNFSNRIPDPVHKNVQKYGK